VTTTAALLALTAACGEQPTLTQSGVPDARPGAQAVSLLGDTLTPPTASPETRTRQMEQLADAWDAYARDPASADAAIWYGRRLAYPGYYRAAIAAYTDAIGAHPDDARLFRHRGHRYISVREFGAAIDDFAVAAKLVQGQPDEVEPDGQPNARNIPTSTLQSNIWYHLGLAHYLRGDFPRALSSYREDVKVATNPDMLVAATYWLYLTLRRLGEDDDARAALEPITVDLDIIENGSYHRLLLLFKGSLPADSLTAALNSDDLIANVTVGYGIGAWHYVNGREAEAEAVWRRILESPQWAGFGYIAAEAEIARLTAQ
jgi:tetratricopeptide (TPR) repeat protein